MSIARIVADFDLRNRDLRDPDGAHGLCCWASGDFARRVPGARVLHLLGSRRFFLRRRDQYPARDPEFYHAVVQVGGVVFDWTYRQLEPRAPHPFVQTLAQLRADWIRIARSASELGL